MIASTKASKTAQPATDWNEKNTGKQKAFFTYF